MELNFSTLLTLQLLFRALLFQTYFLSQGSSSTTLNNLESSDGLVFGKAVPLVVKVSQSVDWFTT